MNKDIETLRVIASNSDIPTVDANELRAIADRMEAQRSLHCIYVASSKNGRVKWTSDKRRGEAWIAGIETGEYTYARRYYAEFAPILRTNYATAAQFSTPLFPHPPADARDALKPIDTAPQQELVIVFWLDYEDKENPERYAFDWLEDGVWQEYFSEHEHYLIAGVAKGNSEDAPYTHWAKLPKLQIDAAIAAKERKE